MIIIKTVQKTKQIQKAVLIFCFFSAELRNAAKHLKEVQQCRVKDYLSKKENENEYAVGILDDIYVELRINDGKYNHTRLEIRTHHDMIELQKKVAKCRPISIAELFQPVKQGRPPPKRILLTGKAAIGKSMLSIHILDKWLNNRLPSIIKHVFYFALRHLRHSRKCSLTGLFYDHHEGNAESDFFQLITTCPNQCLLIFDGADEYDFIPPNWPISIPSESDPTKCIETSVLVSSIIQGKYLKPVYVLVTSRPGGIPEYEFDRTAEIYGLTNDKIPKYVAKFCQGDRDLQKCINTYIQEHVNIASLCYIPMQCGLVCRIVRDHKKHTQDEDFPTTITQLYTKSVMNLIRAHHPRFKDLERVVVKQVISELREPLLNHARLALTGMRKSPVQVTFTDEEIDKFNLQTEATNCGLIALSKVKERVIANADICYHSFNHLTMQELFAAVALVSSPQEAPSMMKIFRNSGQLDLVLLFLCGLIGDHSCEVFLASLGCQVQMTAESLLQLVKGARERQTGSDTKRIILLLLLMIYESRNPALWSTVADYVTGTDKILDLSDQHISPVELQAVTFIFQNDNISSLK